VTGWHHGSYHCKHPLCCLMHDDRAAGDWHAVWLLLGAASRVSLSCSIVCWLLLQENIGLLPACCSCVDRKAVELGLAGARTDFIQTDAAINKVGRGPCSRAGVGGLGWDVWWLACLQLRLALLCFPGATLGHAWSMSTNMLLAARGLA
jgi:hypothetical protein